jgi:hypothetical protein
MTGDESWFHQFDLYTKQQSMEWFHIDLKIRRSKIYPQQEMLWEKYSGIPRDAILVDFLPRKESVSAVCCVQTLQKL